MKTFRHLLGHEAGQTMTVNELMKKMKKYPADMPVFAKWEGCEGFIKAEEFSIHNVLKGHPEDICKCLVIDVNEY